MTRQKTPSLDRFLLKIDRQGDHWLWTASTAPNGAPQFTADGHQHARRWAYAHFHGPIPRGGRITPTCDAPLCVSPYHLALSGGTSHSTPDELSALKLEAAKARQELRSVAPSPTAPTP